MWDYDSLIGKAKAYNDRASSASTESLDFGLWLLFGFEFLARATLARKHPTLLAAPDGESILAALGIEGTRAAKSIPFHTVVTRLRYVVGDFTPEVGQDATDLMNIRNAEMHTGESAIESKTLDSWLPKLIRASKVLTDHLGYEINDLIGEEVVALGERLIDAEDMKLVAEIRKRVEEHRRFWSNLTAGERQQRGAVSRWPVPYGMPCLACGTSVKINYEEARRSGVRVDLDGNRVVSVQNLATSLQCVACGLELGSTAEVRAAGIPHLVQTEEEIDDRYDDVYEPDYGND